MNHALRVRLAERVQRFEHDFRGRSEAERAGAQAGRERLARHQFHHDVILPVLLAHVVNGGNAGMIEPRQRQTLLPEVPPRLGAGQHAGGQHLDGNLAFQPLVVGAVNHAHSARAYRFENRVPAKAASCRQIAFGRNGCSGGIGGRREIAVQMVVIREQRLDHLPQRRVVLAGRCQKSCALIGGQVERLAKDRFRADFRFLHPQLHPASTLLPGIFPY